MKKTYSLRAVKAILTNFQNRKEVNTKKDIYQFVKGL